MKKDMGGAANALGLAQMVMALKLPVRLQLLIPAVENAIAGNAYRPGDVFKTRKGLHIEIGNTDAEGRVILCDALAYAAEGKPELMIDLATLTGAARVALGGQLPALFCRDMDLARDLVDRGLGCTTRCGTCRCGATITAASRATSPTSSTPGRGRSAGAINAALFLEDFVPGPQDWLHIDLFAWNDMLWLRRARGTCRRRWRARWAARRQTLRTLLRPGPGRGWPRWCLAPRAASATNWCCGPAMRLTAAGSTATCIRGTCCSRAGRPGPSTSAMAAGASSRRTWPPRCSSCATRCRVFATTA
jgi:hypothetical protein